MDERGGSGAGAAPERQQLEQALRLAEERARAILDAVGAIVWEGDPRTMAFTFVSARAERLLGFPASAWTADPRFWLDRIHPADREWVVERCRAMTAAGEPHELEYRMVAADGRVVWVRDTVRLAPTAPGEPTRSLGILVDITPSREAAQARGELEARLSAQRRALVGLATGAPLRSGDLEAAMRAVTEVAAATLEVERVSVWWFEPGRGAIRCQVLFRRAADGHGCEGLRMAAADHPGYFAALEEGRAIAADDARTDPRTREFTVSYLGPNGITSLLDVPIRVRGEVAGILCHEHTGAPRRWTADEEAFAAACGDLVALAFEEGQRREALAAVQEAQARLHAVLESAPVITFALDAAGRITLVEGQPLATLGFDPAELLGRPAPDVLPANQQLARDVARALAGETFVSVGQERGRWFETRWRARREGGEVTGVVGVALDVTERLRAEDELRRHREHLEELVAARTRELEALNRELEAFSYSVAHDLRAPLRAIASFAHLLLEDHGPALPADARELLERMGESARQLTRLTEALLALSRASRSELRLEDVDLTALAADIAAELGRGEPARRVEWRIEPGLRARGDPRLLRVVLTNLLGNAWKFTARREVAHIDVGVRPGSDERVFYVRDDGAGFDPAGADAVFLPFRRLHPAEDFPGTGVGLTTVARVIERHGGRVWAEGAAGQGATFSFTLPAGA